VQLARADLGYDAERLLTVRLTVPWKRFGLEGTIRFHHQALERLAQLPGVQSVSLSTDSPVAEQLEPMNPVRVEGESVAEHDANPRIPSWRFAKDRHERRVRKARYSARRLVSGSTRVARRAGT
jgi:hypothetical protein